MIVRICGKLVEVDKESGMVEQNGLTYEILVPHYSISELASHRG